MDISKVEINNCYEVLKNEALKRNEISSLTWFKYKNDLEETKYLLSFLPKKVKHDVMVPIGPKALMRGKIVHTNEFLVNLGDTWFASRTADQTLGICNRRIKTCEEMLEKLKKEMELIVNKSTLPSKEEAFGSVERPEIIEYVTEKENEEWKIQHRLKEKKYRQQLAELRNKEKKKIETEEDLWKHLDDLEAQEELEDELNRLNAEYSNEDIPNENSESDSLFKEISYMEEGVEGNPEKSERTSDASKTKKQVSFVSDWDLSDEPLRLEIKHSKWEPIPSDPNSNEIISPSDIYNLYVKHHGRVTSILKKNKSISEGNHSKLNENVETEDIEEVSENYIKTSTSLHIKDVVERNVGSVSSKLHVDSPFKKISKFKAMRTRNS